VNHASRIDLPLDDALLKTEIWGPAIGALGVFKALAR